MNVVCVMATMVLLMLTRNEQRRLHGKVFVSKQNNNKK